MYNSKLGLILMLLLSAACLATAADVNIREYGAKGDGKTLDTRAIQAAIDAASAAGGGRVVVPCGVYKVGCLVLKDNVDLHVQSGAVVLGSPDIQDYPEIIHKFESRTNKLYAKHFVVFAEGAKNIAITGQGAIDGNGDTHFQQLRPQNLRPYLVRLVNCEQVTIRDIRLLAAANWTCHLLGCRDVLVDGMTIRNKTRANRDGLDIDSCQRVTVSNCRIRSGDDAIVFKSTSNVPCRDIAITNCEVSTQASAIKIGTESNGDFRNIAISNCIITDVPILTGIELMAVDGATMQNVSVNNIVMDNVAIPFFVYLGNRSRPYKLGQSVGRVATVRDIRLSNISAVGAKHPSILAGLNMKQLEDLSLQNISVRYSERLATAPLAFNKVPLAEFDYPMGTMFGENLPAFGLYCRNVEGLFLGNIRFFAPDGEKRPAVVMDNVSDAELRAVRATTGDAMPALAYLRRCRSIVAEGCRTLGAAIPLFEVESDTCDSLKLDGNPTIAGQKLLVETPKLSDRSGYEPLQSDAAYDVADGETVQGLACHDLAAGPLKVTLDIKKKDTAQVCLLVLNTGKQPEDIVLTYNGVKQTMRVDWHAWGWAPLALVKSMDRDEPVKFEIAAAANSHLKIAKVRVRYLQLGYTD
jgi:hypothetical protein